MTADVVTEQQQISEIEAINALQQQQNNLNVDPVTGHTDELPEGYNADGTPKTEQGELLLGKFQTQDELIKAYQEMEQKLGQQEQKPAEEPKQEENNVTKEDGTTFNISKFDTEYSDNGSLSENSYKELADNGFSREQVDRYIAGQKALTEQFTNSLYQSVGGEENYTNLVTWASTNIPQETIVEYNEALKVGNLQKTTQLLEYMNMKAGSGNKQVTRVQGTSTSNPAGTLKPFATKHEWVQAASHPDYGRDAKYSSMVDKRYLASLSAGLI